MFSCVADLLWPLLGKRHVAEVCGSSTLYPWDEHYPFGLNLCPLQEYRLRYLLGFDSDRVVLLDAQCPCPALVDFFPDFFIRAFSACAVASFAVSSATCPGSSEIIFVISATDVLSSCVAVTRFASANVWSCCILVNSSEFSCAAFTCATYPSVLEVIEDLLVSLKARAKWALKFPHVLSLRVLHDRSWKLSWYRPHLSMLA